MIERLLERLARALSASKIPYMLIGGQAVLYYGSVRLTQDVDVTLGIDPDAYPVIVTVCRQARLTPLIKDGRSFVQKTHVLPVADRPSGLRVDFIFSSTPYERHAIARARIVQMGRAKVRVAALEDLIIHKLVAGRPVDVDDVRVLLTTHYQRVDCRYTRRWLAQFARVPTVHTDPLATFDRVRRSVRV